VIRRPFETGHRDPAVIREVTKSELAGAFIGEKIKP